MLFIKKNKIKWTSYKDLFFINKIGMTLSSYGNINWNAGWIVGKTKNIYLSLHMRPKYSKDVKSKSSYNIKKNEFAVIIQGPAIDHFDFLNETVKLYSKIFEGAEIIVSTWANLGSAMVKTLQESGATVLLSELPEDDGYAPRYKSMDYQTLSTTTALEYANKKGIKYALKTRVDWRIYKPNSFAYLKSILKTFPARTDNNLQKGRLVVTSLFTYKYRIYGLTDTMMFGYIEDMIKFWSTETYKDGMRRLGLGDYPVMINGACVVVDTFFVARYLSCIGVKAEWTLDHWWKSLRDHFCVIDADSLDIMETKYDARYEKRLYRSYTTEASRCIEFSDWLALYSGIDINWDSLNVKETWKIENNDFVKVRTL